MVPQQRAEAAALGKPRGNLSDLYPRWLGARELLLHRRNPYSPEITREIQQGYYGRPLDPTRLNDPKDQQGFAYPLYVVFLLAPTLDLPFDQVQRAFNWILILLVVTSGLTWFRVTRFQQPWPTKIILIILMLGWLPVVQGLKLQQLTLLEAALLAGCAACLSVGWLFCAGGLAALATIKPQLALPLVLWLLVWSAREWRSRRRFILGFSLIMILLLGGAELILPGWWRMFLEATRQYRRYTHAQSLLAVLFGLPFGPILQALSGLTCGLLLCRLRHEPPSSAAFGQSIGLVLALTLVLIPMTALYNQMLLIPATLVLLGKAEAIPALRLAKSLAGIWIVWPWIATLGLSAVYLWLTPELRQRVYLVPFYASIQMPIFVFIAALLDAWMHHPNALRDAAPAE